MQQRKYKADPKKSRVCNLLPKHFPEQKKSYFPARQKWKKRHVQTFKKFHCAKRRIGKDCTFSKLCKKVVEDGIFKNAHYSTFITPLISFLDLSPADHRLVCPLWAKGQHISCLLEIKKELHHLLSLDKSSGGGPDRTRMPFKSFSSNFMS